MVLDPRGYSVHFPLAPLSHILKKFSSSVIVVSEWQCPLWMSSWEGIGKKTGQPSIPSAHFMPLVLKLVQPHPHLLPEQSPFSGSAFPDMSPLGSPDSYGWEPTMSSPPRAAHRRDTLGLGSAFRLLLLEKLQTALLGPCQLLVLYLSLFFNFLPEMFEEIVLLMVPCSILDYIWNSQYNLEALWIWPLLPTSLPLAAS